METTITLSVVIDWIFKLLGIILASNAIFQLREAQKRRIVEMYWKIAYEYTSPECHERRIAIKEIQKWLKQKGSAIGEIDGQLFLDKRIVEKYIEVFHDAEFSTDNKKLDVKARHHIRFLNQVGILVKKKLIDQDLLFSLIGTSLQLEYATLETILAAHVKAHDESMYENFKYLWHSYRKWKQKSGILGHDC